MSREQAEAKLKVATDRVEVLESLVEIERLSGRQSGRYDAKQVQELEAHLKKGMTELAAAERQLGRWTRRPT